MASSRVEQVVFGLLYLWLRDSDLPLTPRTARYVKGHCRAMVGGEKVEYSSEEIVAFIEEERLAHWLVQRLRQFRPKARRTRYQRDLIYGRASPRVRVTSLDKE